MASSPRRPRSLLALVLLTATIGVATAGATMARQGPPPDAERATVAVGAVRTAVSRAGAARTPAGEPVVRDDPASSLRREHRLTPAPAPQGTAWISRPSADTPAPRPRTESKADGTSGDMASGGSFTGRNRVWIPALGIRRSVSSFACSSNAYPGDRVYRWGCAGRNNIYLFGHAHSVFKPLHDAYVRGRLSKGMKVVYADGNGRVSTYKVAWWKVTTPDRGEFAYAAQSRPSMTLQTCVGARSQYRLIVRLVKVG